MAKPWLTSDSLIDAVKRKISFPISQVTFTEEDILAFMNEEMMISQVPSVLQFHEEYYVREKDIPLVDNVSRYSIPPRSIGMRLRDLFWKDSGGNLTEMTRINAEEKAFFQSSGSGQLIHKYYLEGNDVVLSPSNTSSPTGSLVMSYFERPNQLVRDSRAATCTSFVKTITVDNTSLVAGNTVTIGEVVFTAVAGAPSTNQFQIGGNSATTATNLNNAINLNATYGSTVASSIISIFYDILYTSFDTNNTTSFSIQTTQSLQFDNIPSNIATNVLIDFLQTDPGHKIHSTDVKILANSISGDIITFQSDSIPENFKVGDYICEQYECIIPYLPTDLHTNLVDKTCSRILAAIGDTAGLQTMAAKIAENEARQGTLLDSRVEGSPNKVMGRHSLVRQLKTTIRRSR
jgi:hypothetical protein